jgi:hypothetical protein
MVKEWRPDLQGDSVTGDVNFSQVVARQSQMQVRVENLSDVIQILRAG